MGGTLGGFSEIVRFLLNCKGAASIKIGEVLDSRKGSTADTAMSTALVIFESGVNSGGFALVRFYE